MGKVSLASCASYCSLSCYLAQCIWLSIKHIKTVSRTAFFHLLNIAKICHFLSKNYAVKFIHAFVTSSLDYCNGLLSGYLDKALNKLQLVLNTAARILTRTINNYHITPVLASLHWLPVKARVDFKVLLLIYKALHGLAPTYLSDLVLRTYLQVYYGHKTQAS